MEITKAFKAKIDGQEQSVDIKRLTLGERNEINRQSATTRIVGGVLQAELDPGKVMEMTLRFGVVRPRLSPEQVLNLDAEEADVLLGLVQEMNPFLVRSGKSEQGEDERPKVVDGTEPQGTASEHRGS